MNLSKRYSIEFKFPIPGLPGNSRADMASTTFYVDATSLSDAMEQGQKLINATKLKKAVMTKVSAPWLDFLEPSK